LGCTDLLVNGDFESGQEGWHIANSPYPAALDSTTVYSGTTSVRLGIPVGQPNTHAHSAALQNVTLPADAAAITLYYWEQTGGESADADYRELLARPDVHIEVSDEQHRFDPSRG